MTWYTYLIKIVAESVDEADEAMRTALLDVLGRDVEVYVPQAGYVWQAEWWRQLCACRDIPRPDLGEDFIEFFPCEEHREKGEAS